MPSTAWVMGVPGALALAVYANTLLAGFVWDDDSLVLHNQALTGVGALFEAFGQPFLLPFQSPGEVFGTAGARYYRPLVHMLLAVTRAVAGPTPWVFHAINVVGHAVTSALVALTASVAFRTGGRAPTLGAVAAGAWFALHPAHTEAVAWVSGVGDVFSTLLVTATVWVSRPSRGITPARAGALAALCLAAALFKEPGFLALAVVAWHAVGRPQPERQRLLLSMLVAIGVVGALRSVALSDALAGRTHGALGLDGWARGAALLWGQALRWLVAPPTLNAYHLLEVPDSWLSAPVVSGLCALGALGTSWAAWSSARPTITLLALAVLPGTIVPVLGHNAFAERYLYLPSVAAAWLFGRLIALVPERAPVRTATFALVALVSMGAFAATWQRNRVWQSDLSLFLDIEAASPTTPLLPRNLSKALLETGDNAGVISRYEHVPHLNAFAGVNLATAYARTHRLDAAERALLEVLKDYPRHADAWMNLCVVQQATKRYQEALETCGRGITLDEGSAEYAAIGGRALWLAGQTDAARRETQRALQLDPQNQHARELAKRLAMPDAQ